MIEHAKLFDRSPLPSWLWWLLLAVLILPFLFVPVPAHTYPYTCADVRSYVRSHSPEDVERIKAVLTPAQRKAAEACMRKRHG